MGFNPGGAINEAGNDAIIANTRVRALPSNVTYTDASGTVTLSALPLGVNYIDGAGSPITITTFSSGGSSIVVPANNFLTGIIVCRPASAGNSITTDSALNLYNSAVAAAPSGVQVGDFISVLIMNDSAVAMTVTMGSSVTSANTNTTGIAANSSRYCLMRFTSVSASAPTATMYF